MSTPSPQLLSIAIASPLRQIFHYALPATMTRPKEGTRVAVPFGNQKTVMGIVIDSDTTLPVNITPKPIHDILDNEPILTPEILQLCQWCARYYHYPLGEACHLALPALLRKPLPIPTPAHKAWRLSAKGHQVEASFFGRAKKQAQAWRAIKEEQVLTYKKGKTLGISATILKALHDKNIIEKTTADITDTPATVDNTTTILPNSPLAEEALPLNHEQSEALERIHYDTFNSYLLEGVTGSGKTEVYLQAITKVITQGKQVLILVPEIGLTPQTFMRFKQRFNVPIGTLHSGMSEKQRLQAWQDAKQGNTPIVIGTRSAIFAPVPDLGLIIVDEEHDLSYKQQEGIRYSARDLAVIRAQKKAIPIILGSATPALETLHNAHNKRFIHSRLRQRATKVALPNIQCVDYPGDDIAPEIIASIQTTLANKQQVLVFINRRGYAPTLLCQQCGWISQCSRCDSRMTLHRQRHQRYLHCHQCDNKQATPSSCPDCHSKQLMPLGTGTQRSEESLKQQFSQTPIFRIDRDSTSRKGYLEETLNTINNGEPCILIGTQMLAKGHHFSRVALVVVLEMDNGFFSSDFRGTERMGQLLTQVAGRAGREHKQGTVLIQTQFSQHPLLTQLIDQGYHVLATQLLSERQSSQMPPYQHMAMIRCHAQQAAIAVQFLQQALSIIHQWQIPGIQCIGPLPALIEKRNNRYYYQLQIKSLQRHQLHTVLHELCNRLDQQRAPKGLHWLIDVDPQEA